MKILEQKNAGSTWFDDWSSARAVLGGGVAVFFATGWTAGGDMPLLYVHSKNFFCRFFGDFDKLRLTRNSSLEMT